MITVVLSMKQDMKQKEDRESATKMQCFNEFVQRRPPQVSRLSGLFFYFVIRIMKIFKTKKDNIRRKRNGRLEKNRKVVEFVIEQSVPQTYWPQTDFMHSRLEPGRRDALRVLQRAERNVRFIPRKKKCKA